MVLIIDEAESFRTGDTLRLANTIEALVKHLSPTGAPGVFVAEHGTATLSPAFTRKDFKRCLSFLAKGRA